MIVPAKIVLHRHRQQLGVQRLALLAEGLVPGQQDARHAVIGRHVAVDQKLGGDLAVDTNLLHHTTSDGVAEHVALLTGGVVVAHIHRRVKALVDALHHAARLKGPAADQLHILRHLLRVNVDTRPVRVLDYHQLCPRRVRALGGGEHLVGHLLAVALIVVSANVGGIPGGGKGGPLNVRADEYFLHSHSFPFSPHTLAACLAGCYNKCVWLLPTV